MITFTVHYSIIIAAIIAGIAVVIFAFIKGYLKQNKKLFNERTRYEKWYEDIKKIYRKLAAEKKQQSDEIIMLHRAKIDRYNQGYQDGWRAFIMIGIPELTDALLEISLKRNKLEDEILELKTAIKEKNEFIEIITSPQPIHKTHKLFVTGAEMYEEGK